MKISIDHFAHLARLSLSEEETKLFSSQIEDILDYIDKLNELDSSSVEPTSHVISIQNVVREDTPRASLSRENALKNAPDRDSTGAFYRVPKIIE